MNDFSPISTAGYLFIICMGILLLRLPRRRALIPLFLSGCYMTLGQALLIGPLHFSIFRIMLLFGWVRILWKNELALMKLNYIDKALMTWVAASSLIYVLNRGMSADSIICQLGEVYDTIGIYFLLRALILGMDDIVHAVRLLEILIVPLAVILCRGTCYRQKYIFCFRRRAAVYGNARRRIAMPGAVQASNSCGNFCGNSHAAFCRTMGLQPQTAPANRERFHSLGGNSLLFIFERADYRIPDWHAGSVFLGFQV